MKETRDEFLSEEDLDLQSLSDEELFTYWTLWLRLHERAFRDFGVLARIPISNYRTT